MVENIFTKRRYKKEGDTVLDSKTHSTECQGSILRLGFDGASSVVVQCSRLVVLVVPPVPSVKQ